ncbi:MAG: tetraacyldisaccharide 4'-kinase [Oleiphilaceae bacterium]|nr:tetraacyldisaccharide 4'-kinase [Oleiphilaceae bacterium]
MTGWVDRLWYGSGRPLWPLWPLAQLYRRVAASRREKAQLDQASLPVPVIVVGNITAGGTGKSPLTAWLVETLLEEGWRPVILSRGYRGKAESYPLLVDGNTDAAAGGDEPVMLARQTGCPVVVDPRRVRGAQWAIARNLGNILVCDDGLQHYALPRDIELAVFDGQRGLGNGAPIPVGPLREDPERLAQVDFVIGNGGVLETVAHPAQYLMTLAPTALRRVASGEAGNAETEPLAWLQGRPVRAVAGIGNPERFFDTLRSLGARVRSMALPDHHDFSRSDLAVEPGEHLVMTAKDAVKCRHIAHDRCWALEVKARLPEAFRAALLARLAQVSAGNQNP